MFIEEGIVWLSEIINNNPHLQNVSLPKNTIFYIEEYISEFIKEHISALRMDVELKRKIGNVLDFLVLKGSTMGYFLREELF